MEKERREAMALIILRRMSEKYSDSWFNSKTELIGFAKQLLDETGKRLFSVRKNSDKKNFVDFCERCTAGNFIEGDGEMAIATLQLDAVGKMNGLQKKGDKRFAPHITADEVREIFTDFKLTKEERLDAVSLLEWLKKDAFEKVTRKIKREKTALMIAHKRNLIVKAPWYSSKREQNSVAGQLRNEMDKLMFPEKKDKLTFADFLERTITGKYIDGDGEIAVAWVIFHYRHKMVWLSKEKKERFKPYVTIDEVEETFTDEEEIGPLQLSQKQLLDLLSLIDWVKSLTYKKVTRSSK